MNVPFETNMKNVARILKEFEDRDEYVTGALAIIELMAGSAEAALAKMDEAPASAVAHLEEAIAAAKLINVEVKDGKYSKEARQMRRLLSRPRR